ncbi:MULTISPECIES: hypothetical protein [Streptosporangium]|uniref:BatC protein n=1 Tax=Streptosporangium brasiliense TaxID=47480 RepID=A0ABT9RGB8_9ACTN|nr:hypothetical protein [Streptosporangium brasiliense]MDP9867410.1 hypothetical protein [Streptosporangium brasiliense]
MLEQTFSSDRADLSLLPGPGALAHGGSGPAGMDAPQDTPDGPALADAPQGAPDGPDGSGGPADGSGSPDGPVDGGEDGRTPRSGGDA